MFKKKKPEKKTKSKVQFETTVISPRVEFKADTNPRIRGYYAVEGNSVWLEIGERCTYSFKLETRLPIIQDVAILQTLYRQLHQILQHMGKLPCVD